MSITTKDVHISKITFDGSCQLREELDDDAVDDYAASYSRGEVLPPPRLFFDGTTYWPADGHHRIKAKEKAGSKMIECEVQDGTKDDAIIFAAASNKGHGVRRTAADKRKTIRALLKVGSWAEMSDRVIAQHVGCDPKTIAACREGSGEEIPHRRKTADGRTIEVPPKAAPVHCDRCSRTGPITDCPKCEALQAEAGRPAKAKKKPKPAGQGEVLFDMKNFDAAIGPCRRVIDTLYRGFGKLGAGGAIKRDAQYNGMDRLLSEFEKLFRLRLKDLLKEHKAAK